MNQKIIIHNNEVQARAESLSVKEREEMWHGLVSAIKHAHAYEQIDHAWNTIFMLLAALWVIALSGTMLL